MGSVRFGLSLRIFPAKVEKMRSQPDCLQHYLPWPFISNAAQYAVQKPNSAVPFGASVLFQSIPEAVRVSPFCDQFALQRLWIWPLI
ncbi:hypothethical protein (plasmid) [Ralstonia solanacearum CMR15]|nr:hypothethical protein [Ralstonia solanacearum CMR15]